MIDIRHVSKSYGQVQALADINLSVAKGEFVSVIGPSGSGKTTLLKIVGGLLKPSSGEVLVHSHPPDTVRRRGEFGFVFQKPVLLPWRTLRENVELPLELLRDSKFSSQGAGEILAELGLKDFENALPRQLSGGMQQRCALARALVFRPDVLLMDEPFAALDELLRERLDVELVELTERLNQTVLHVTHHIVEAALLSHRIAVLSERPGRIKEIIPVDLGRPRDRERGSDRHLRLVKKIREILEQ